MNDIRRRVESTIEKQTGHGENGYLDERLKAFDLFDQIQLACDLEEEFQISVNDIKLQGCRSLDEVSKYIESLVAKEG